MAYTANLLTQLHTRLRECASLFTCVQVRSFFCAAVEKVRFDQAQRRPSD